MASARQQFVEWCVSQCGKPVLMGAKGDFWVDGQIVRAVKALTSLRDGPSPQISGPAVQMALSHAFDEAGQVAQYALLIPKTDDTAALAQKKLDELLHDLSAKVRVILPPFTAYDCSGLGTSGIKVVTGKELRDSHNAQKLADECGPFIIGEPQPGEWGFYGQNWQSVNHVVIATAGDRLVSADGATSSIHSLAAARANPACRVRLHDSFAYRRDEPFLGWRHNIYLPEGT